MAIDNLITDSSLQPLVKTCQAVLSQAQKMLDWLQEHGHTPNPSLDLQLELAEQQKIMHVYLAKLRGLHRRVVFGARDTKQVTAEARQEVDRLLLQLQNLYYEQRHLMGEIGSCEAYE
jgi:THO complex subunit 5